MMETKNVKTGSKTNLNESTLPLLEEQEGKGETPEKEEKIEMETKGGDAEKHDKEDEKDGNKAEKKKKKKEKEPKEKKEKKDRQTPITCAQNFTIGLNVHDRDEKKINDSVNIMFEDVIAEPDASHGFEFVWRLTFLLFNSTKFWLYRVIAAFLALPLAFFWAVVFALVNVGTIWCCTPSLRLFTVGMFYLRRFWSGLVRTFLDPFFESAALLLGGIRSKVESTTIVTA